MDWKNIFQEYFIYIVLIIVGIFILWKYRKEIFSALGTKTSSFNMTNYAVDLTEKAREGKIDPVIGREEEIERLVQILSRRKKNNPLLIGSAGVGKTAVVEGLALRLVTGDASDALQGKKILMINLADMMSGTKYRGELEDRIKKLVDSVTAQGRQIILFIDEIHTLVQTKGTEGAMNISDIIKPGLARGDLQLIGATTSEEYEEYIKADNALDRRFQLVEVSEPTEEQTVEILRGIKKEYEDYHHVEFEDEAIQQAVKLTGQYINNRKFPDKAIDLLDESGVAVNLRLHDLPDTALKLIRAVAEDVHLRINSAPANVKDLLEELEELKRKEDDLEDEEEKDVVMKEIIALTKKIEEQELKNKKNRTKQPRPKVTSEDVKKVIEKWQNTNINK